MVIDDSNYVYLRPGRYQLPYNHLGGHDDETTPDWRLNPEDAKGDLQLALLFLDPPSKNVPSNLKASLISRLNRLRETGSTSTFQHPNLPWFRAYHRFLRSANFEGRLNLQKLTTSALLRGLVIEETVLKIDRPLSMVRGSQLRLKGKHRHREFFVIPKKGDRYPLLRETVLGIEILKVLAKNLRPQPEEALRKKVVKDDHDSILYKEALDSLLTTGLLVGSRPNKGKGRYVALNLGYRYDSLQLKPNSLTSVIRKNLATL